MKLIVAGSRPMSESYAKEAASEYVKRLTRFCKIESPVIKPEKLTQFLPGHERSGSEDTAFIPVNPRGRLISSEELADLIGRASVGGKSRLIFYHGDILDVGINDNIMAGSIYDHISISRLDIGRDLERVILLEQLYRAFKILNNEAYHK